MPLIFHGQAAVTIKPGLFSQIMVIIISGILIVLVSKMPLTLRLYLIWCVIGVFTSRVPLYSAIALTGITLVIFLYLWMARLSREDYKFTFKYITIGVCAQVFWILAQTLNRDFIMNLPRDAHIVFGTLGNKNLLGAMFLFSIAPVYFYKKWAVILPIIGVLYSRASGAMFALAGGMLLFFIFYDIRPYLKAFSRDFAKTLLILCLIMSGALAWQYVDNPVNGFKCGRLPIWNKVVTLMFTPEDPRERVFNYYLPGIANNYNRYKDSKPGELRDTCKKNVLELHKKMNDTLKNLESAGDINFLEKIRNPWLGYGVGTFRFEFPKRLTIHEAGGVSTDKDGKLQHDSSGKPIPIRWDKAHNTYLQIGREQGLIGMFFIMLIPAMMFARFLKNPKTEYTIVSMAMILMICLNAVGNFPDREPALMYMILYNFALFNIGG